MNKIDKEIERIKEQIAKLEVELTKLKDKKKKTIAIV
jgi:hypothetical protein